MRLIRSLVIRRTSKLLQQAVEIVELFLGAAALPGAPAQLLQDRTRPLQLRLIGNLHVAAEAWPAAAALPAQRILAAHGSLLAVAIHQVLGERGRALALGFGRVVERAVAEIALRLAHLLAGIAQILRGGTALFAQALHQLVELLTQ